MEVDDNNSKPVAVAGPIGSASRSVIVCRSVKDCEEAVKVESEETLTQYCQNHHGKNYGKGTDGQARASLYICNAYTNIALYLQIQSCMPTIC